MGRVIPWAMRRQVNGREHYTIGLILVDVLGVGQVTLQVGIEAETAAMQKAGRCIQVMLPVLRGRRRSDHRGLGQ